jgi:hypothetical protein
MDGTEQGPVALPAEVARQLPAWRRKYGPDLIFIPKWEIVLRPLNRGELIDFERNAAADLIWAQIDLFKQCLIWPADWAVFADNISLADFQSAFDALHRASGFRNPEAFTTDLAEWRILVMQRDHAVIRHICKAFPKFDEIDVNAMPRSRILYLLAQAEFILGVTYDGQDLGEMYDKLAAEAQAKAIKERHAKMRAQNARPGRTFSVEKDARGLQREETDVSDINKPISRSTRDLTNGG